MREKSRRGKQPRLPGSRREKRDYKTRSYVVTTSKGRGKEGGREEAAAEH